MKRHLNISLATILLVGVLAAAAQAQTSSAQKMVANIPFTFNVGQTELPAGKYTITVVNPSSDRKVLQIRNADGHLSAMIQTTSELRNADGNAKLVFHRYGDRYFFAQAQMAGDMTSLAAVKTKAERTEREAIAKAGKKSVVVTLTE
jgi:hypothetical protein